MWSLKSMPFRIMFHGFTRVTYRVAGNFSRFRPENADGVLKNRTGPYEGVSRRETARWKAIAYSYLAHYFVLDPTQRIGFRYDETGWICTAGRFWAKNTTCDIEERAKTV